MTRADPPGDLAELAALIEDQLGLQCEPQRAPELEALLEERLRTTGSRDLDEYRTRLTSPLTRGAEVQALAERLTVGETYFFREQRDFDVFTGVAIPRVLAAKRGGAQARVLSIGCSSGEEPYSLAIALRESGGLDAARVAIHAFDINARAVERARRACYSPWSLRSTPQHLRERYFRPAGRDHELIEELRGAVTFEQRNLLDDDPAFWIPRSFDVIFCRNVVMYFSPRRLAAAVERLAAALAPGGFVFLGSSERLHGISSQLDLVRVGDTFCHVRRAASTPPAPAAAPGPAPGGHGDAAALDEAISLFRAERFHEALDVLEREPLRASPRVEATLLRATILVNQGKLQAAEAACREVLAREPRSPSAEYLLALCRAQAGDTRAAMQHHLRAIQIDPAFAMSHMQLGMLARRSGDLAAASASLRAALTLLEREDSRRLDLLSGGFSRGALIELSRTELAACREAP